MPLTKEEVESFNDQIDRLKNELGKKFETADRRLDTHIAELWNRMEIARRVFNHFNETGKVEIPD